MLARPRILLGLVVALCLISISSALAFSFDFGDDDDDWWRYAYRGDPNQPWIAPNGMLFYPRLPYFERNRLLDQRQLRMGRNYDAMDQLGAMLYGDAAFDRAMAIKLARRIEATAGRSLSAEFHPGSIATDRSRTLLALWHNRPLFDANSEALRAAAKALAEELEKNPDGQAGAVMLRGKRLDSDQSAKSVAVSAAVWERFNRLSDVCDSCHRGFRGYRW